jgi:hypothetical protein
MAEDKLPSVTAPQPPLEVTAGGVTIAHAYSRQQLYSTAKVPDGKDKNIQRGVYFGIGGNKRASAWKLQVTRSTRNARRPGALRPSVGGAEDNRPVIEIVATRGGEIRSLGVFDSFILMNVQEQDAEKGFVVETFGTPHFFSAGRFVRKYVFAGRLRTTPVNWLAVAPEYRVPQAVLFRRFYDDHLRMTQQVRLGRFTRVTVDGDIYDGYVTMLNLARASDPETVADFGFTLLGIRRTHVDLESDAVSLLKGFEEQPGERESEFSDTMAAAELTDALGKLELKLDGLPEKTTQEIEVTEAGGVTGGTQLTVLTAVGATQTLAASTTTPGVALIYADGTKGPVHATLADMKSDGRPLTIQVTDYRALYGSLGEPDTERKVHGLVDFEISSPTAAPVKLNVQVVLAGAATFRVIGATVDCLAAKPKQVAATRGTSATIILPELVHAVNDPGNVLYFDLTLQLQTRTGVAFSAGAFSGAQVTVDVKAVPALAAPYALVGGVDVNRIVIGSVGTGLVVEDEKAQTLRIPLSVKLYATNKDGDAILLRDGDPFFDVASHVLLVITPTVKLAMYASAKDSLPAINMGLKVQQGASPLAVVAAQQTSVELQGGDGFSITLSTLLVNYSPGPAMDRPMEISIRQALQLSLTGASGGVIVKRSASWPAPYGTGDSLAVGIYFATADNQRKYLPENTLDLFRRDLSYVDGAYSTTLLFVVGKSSWAGLTDPQKEQVRASIQMSRVDVSFGSTGVPPTSGRVEQ